MCCPTLFFDSVVCLYILFAVKDFSGSVCGLFERHTLILTLRIRIIVSHCNQCIKYISSISYNIIIQLGLYLGFLNNLVSYLLVEHEITIMQTSDIFQALLRLTCTIFSLT